MRVNEDVDGIVEVFQPLIAQLGMEGFDTDGAFAGHFRLAFPFVLAGVAAITHLFDFRWLGIVHFIQIINQRDGFFIGGLGLVGGGVDG